MKRYPVPAQETRCEMVVVNSRFIATLAPPGDDFDAWMREVRDIRRHRRERAEALWRKHGRPEIT